MKLKGSSKNLSAAKIIALFTVFGIAFLALRIYQTGGLIDPATGFYTDKNDITVKLFVVLSAVLALVTPLLLYLSPLSKAEYIEPKRHVLHGVICVLLGLSAGYSAYSLFSSGEERTKTVLAVIVMGALACAVLIIDGIGFIAGGKLVNKLKIVNLFPVLWALTLTVSNFSITTSYLNNTVLLIKIFADAFLMLFLFQYAKKFSGIYGDGNSPIFIYSALMCALLELSAFVQGVMLKSGTTEFYRAAAALFCVSALVIMLKNRVPDYVPREDGDAIETVPFKLSSEEKLNEAPVDEAPLTDAHTEAPEAENNDEA